MTTVVTTNLKLAKVEDFVSSIESEVYYLFTGWSLPFTDDLNPPTLSDRVSDVYIDPYAYMINAKKLSNTNVSPMVKRYDWEYSTVYTKYSHDNSSILSSNFFVLVDEGAYYSVFKCLDNNNGSTSTDSPSITGTSPGDDVYFTSDGYQWKYMYSLTQIQYDSFATTEYIPVFANTQVSANAIPGSIDNIEVSTIGYSYCSYTSGTFQQIAIDNNTLKFRIESGASSNTNFYTGSAIKIIAGTGAGQQRTLVGYDGTGRIVTLSEEFVTLPDLYSQYSISPLVTVIGDGSGAVARGIVNAVSNSIYRIEITSRGSGYTYATATVTGNTGIVAASTAQAKVIISPPGGHGSNTAAELGCRYVGVSTVFDSTASSSKVINENDFRSIGIIKNPLFANVQFTFTSPTGTFITGQQLVQYNSVPVAGIVITNPGSGYYSNAAVSFSGGGGSGAVANTSANTLGRISTIVLANSGSGYEFAPTVVLSDPAAQTFNSNTSVSAAQTFYGNTTTVLIGNTIANGYIVLGIANTLIYSNNDIVRYMVAAGNTAIGGLTTNTLYYVRVSNTTTIQLASNSTSPVINLTSVPTSAQPGHSLSLDFIKITNNRFQNNDYIKYLVASGNSALSTIANNTSYYVVQANTSGIRLSTTLNGTHLSLTPGVTQTGHSFTGQTAIAAAVVNISNTIIADGIVLAANSTNMTITNTHGFFINGGQIKGLANGYVATLSSISTPSTYIDQTVRISGSLSFGSFLEDEQVIQATTNSSGYVYFANNTVLRLVNTKGSFNPYSLITGTTSSSQWIPSNTSLTIVSPDFVKNSGDVIYIEKFTPITKATSQTETFKLIFEF